MAKTEILISENLPNFLHTTNEGSVMSTLLKHFDRGASSNWRKCINIPLCVVATSEVFLEETEW